MSSTVIRGDFLVALGAVALLGACGGNADEAASPAEGDVIPGSGGGSFVGGPGGTPGAAGFLPVAGGGAPPGMGGAGAGGASAGPGGAPPGMGGSPLAAGGAWAGTGGFVGTGDPPRCVSSPSEVVILGDSYVTGAASPALQPTMALLDPAAAQFRNYAVAGTSFATGGITGLIPPQLDLAIGLGPKIQLIIMDGGGNDILLCDGIKFPGCGGVCNRAGSSSQKVCTDIVGVALDAGRQFLDKVAQAGVRDLVYFFYPHVTSNMGGYVEMIDYAEPLFQQVCRETEAATGGKLRCHFVDLVQPFTAAGGDLNPLNFSFDGIHPSQAGQDIMAREITNVMKTSCLGQPASSGCCAP